MSYDTILNTVDLYGQYFCNIFNQYQSNEFNRKLELIKFHMPMFIKDNETISYRILKIAFELFMFKICDMDNVIMNISTMGIHFKPNVMVAGVHMRYNSIPLFKEYYAFCMSN